MDLTLRPGTPQDVQECGRICYEAFHDVATQHGFPSDFTGVEEGVAVCGALISHPGFYSVVAESDGRILGSNFLDERSTIAGVGPITVDPEVQNGGVGRALMLDVMERARDPGFVGTRLLQSGYHNRSLSLYAKLGFDPRDTLAAMQGPPLGEVIPGFEVRLTAEDDVEGCNAVCHRVHGHDRGGELSDAIARKTAKVVERDGRITGYTTGIAFLGHSVGESIEDLQALIASAEQFTGPGFLVPIRNAELFRWCLERGLRVVQLMTLMSVGFYQEPTAPWMPSVLY
jgi:GNAT superfamily N-acetyltransferase